MPLGSTDMGRENGKFGLTGPGREEPGVSFIPLLMRQITGY